MVERPRHPTALKEAHCSRGRDQAKQRIFIGGRDRSAAARASSARFSHQRGAFDIVEGEPSRALEIGVGGQAGRLRFLSAQRDVGERRLEILGFDMMQRRPRISPTRRRWLFSRRSPKGAACRRPPLPPQTCAWTHRRFRRRCEQPIMLRHR
jgi:hypothetical protein